MYTQNIIQKQSFKCCHFYLIFYFHFRNNNFYIKKTKKLEHVVGYIRISTCIFLSTFYNSFYVIPIFYNFVTWIVVAYEWIHADITHKCSFHLLYMKITDYLKEIKQFVDCSCLFKFIYTDYYIQSFSLWTSNLMISTKMQETI